MMKASILCSLLLFVVLFVAQCDAVGQLGGYVRGGGKINGGSSATKVLRYHSTYRSRSTHTSLPLEKPYEERRSEAFERGVVSVVLFLLAILISYVLTEGLSAQNTTIMMVQVAVKNRSPEIQSNFSQMSETLTRSDEGLSWREAHCILSAMKKHILLRPEHCFSATSSVVDVIKDKNIWEERFEQKCNEQLSKSNGTAVKKVLGCPSDYVVVTVLVASYGVQKVPAVNCLADLEKAFSFLESLTDYLAAVKVFWTPSGETSKLLLVELMKEFDELNRLEVQGRKKPPRSPPLMRQRGRLREGYKRSTRSYW